PVEIIVSNRFINGVTQIQPANVPVAGPAEIKRVHIVRHQRAERFGASQVAILIVMRAAVIEVRVKTQLRRVAVPEEVLPIDVCDKNILAAPPELIQLGVRVLLVHVEHDHVVLPAIVVVIAKQTRGEIHVVENKSAKIAVERLVAESARYK